MDVRKIPMPPKSQDPKDIQKVFDDYKRAKQAPIPEIQAPSLPYVSHDEVMIQVKDLPSKMLPYPTGSTIFFKPYTYGDMQVFNSSSLPDEDRLKFILDGIITNGFDKSKLTFQDFMFIAILRKVSAFNSSKFTYRFICSDCGEINNQTADLSSIEFKDLEIPSLPLIVDVDDQTSLYLNPLTIGSSMKLRDVKDDYFLKAYSECVINMPAREAYLIMKAAQGDLIEVLEEADRMLGFGEQSIDCKCDKCKAVNKFQLGDIQHLVLPYRGDPVNIKNKIRFS